MNIAFVFEEDYLGAYPSFVESIKLLSENGYNIDIIGKSRDSNFPNAPTFNENVNFILLKDKDSISREYENYNSLHDYKPKNVKNNTRWFSKLFPKLLKKSLRDSLNYFRENFKNISIQFKTFKKFLLYSFFVSKCLSNKNYKFVIAVDLLGGSSTYFYSLLFNQITYVYWGLEITTLQQPLLIDKIIKFLESFYAKRANVILTTDRSRGLDLSKENRFNFHRKSFIYLPHSPSGLPKKSNSTFFQDMFNLNNETTIILHSGWIHDVMCSSDLAHSTLTWKSSIKLVLHERMKRDINEPYIEKIINHKSPQTLLSLNPVDYDQIDDLVLSSDIGLVIYDSHKKWGSSWVSLGKGSGKIAHYLRCSKPVICSNLKGFSEIIKKYDCGILFDDIEEIPFCIDKILDNYDYYSFNALNCYKNEYEFSKYFQNFQKYIKTVSN